MKLGIVGTGNVGCAIALAAVTRGSAREIVLVNRTRKTAEAVATDLRYGTPLTPRLDIRDGDYGDLTGCGAVLITSGVNEKSGGATDRNDPQGRLRLLDKNAAIYREIVPQIVRAAPDAVLVAVTDPPDPLADIARQAAGHPRVLSAGTFLDSLRFRVHLGRHFGVDPVQVSGPGYALQAPGFTGEFSNDPVVSGRSAANLCRNFSWKSATRSPLPGLKATVSKASCEPLDHK